MGSSLRNAGKRRKNHIKNSLVSPSERNTKPLPPFGKTCIPAQDRTGEAKNTDRLTRKGCRYCEAPPAACGSARPNFRVVSNGKTGGFLTRQSKRAAPSWVWPLNIFENLLIPSQKARSSLSSRLLPLSTPKIAFPFAEFMYDLGRIVRRRSDKGKTFGILIGKRVWVVFIR